MRTATEMLVRGALEVGEGHPRAEGDVSWTVQVGRAGPVRTVNCRLGSALPASELRYKDCSAQRATPGTWIAL